MQTLQKLKVLFLCTGNSCRSQMAEGWAKQLLAEKVQAFSAGIETHGLNPRAVQAMARAGVDISAQQSKHLDDLKDIDFDYVITLCDHADQNCPAFGGKAKVIHAGFEDPAKAQGSEKEVLAIFGMVCKQIKEFVEHLPEYLQKQEKE